MPFLDYLLDHNLAHLGLLVFLALCGCGIPIPEEAPLVLAGALSSQGLLEPWLAFGCCLTGALLGDSIMYAIGRRLGHGWLTRHPSMARFIDAEKEEKFEHAVRRHGFKVLFFTRFLVGVRGPVYYAAGAARVPYLRFLLWDAISATTVVGAVFGLGYVFGESITKVVRSAETAATAIVVIGLMLAGVYFLYKKALQTSKVAEALEEIADHDAEDAAREAGEDPHDGATPDDEPADVAM